MYIVHAPNLVVFSSTTGFSLALQDIFFKITCEKQWDSVETGSPEKCAKNPTGA